MKAAELTRTASTKNVLLCINKSARVGGRVSFLWHSFGQTVPAKCVARLKDHDTDFGTDLLPVGVKTVSPEILQAKVEKLVLFDFALNGARHD
jgi:hypothetical protein